MSAAMASSASVLGVSSFTREEVERVAVLARLQLSDEEAETIAQDLGEFLGYVTALQELDTEGVEATDHAIPLPTPTRGDQPSEPLDPELALLNAPDRDGSAFAVPKVIASDEVG
jgi:aspartyl-tRNA(Asn)/glutamyl-tRNA(Gln) amidotransferase subunit C